MLGDPIVAARGRLEQHARGGLCVAAAAGKAQPNFVLAQVQLRLCFLFCFCVLLKGVRRQGRLGAKAAGATVYGLDPDAAPARVVLRHPGTGRGCRTVTAYLPNRYGDQQRCDTYKDADTLGGKERVAKRAAREPAAILCQRNTRLLNRNNFMASVLGTLLVATLADLRDLPTWGHFVRRASTTRDVNSREKNSNPPLSFAHNMP